MKQLLFTLHRKSHAAHAPPGEREAEDPHSSITIEYYGQYCIWYNNVGTPKEDKLTQEKWLMIWKWNKSKN